MNNMGQKKNAGRWMPVMNIRKKMCKIHAIRSCDSLKVGPQVLALS